MVVEVIEYSVDDILTYVTSGNLPDDYNREIDRSIVENIFQSSIIASGKNSTMSRRNDYAAKYLENLYNVRIGGFDTNNLYIENNIDIMAYYGRAAKNCMEIIDTVKVSLIEEISNNGSYKLRNSYRKLIHDSSKIIHRPGVFNINRGIKEIYEESKSMYND